ncbi:hypothetical protein HETIRDRAFT_452326 [Heterobasidion irregulare TC 32-1]|uniref:Uncharacterized protein n=1 Tax=Heterobasidion irregulare (strain TC 32-1) TaxID=747525 RepID=W4K4U7_HETIT|nr:uncharacterized protein HETIRDRAFT_452326 [Heterobasidion irregulare TC 32-1]ETW80838.1 hypothetical protein HETIRDRAFT_452326 [Heterobasidion irregulare TC 32-1]
MGTARRWYSTAHDDNTSPRAVTPLRLSKQTQTPLNSLKGQPSCARGPEADAPASENDSTGMTSRRVDGACERVAAGSGWIQRMPRDQPGVRERGTTERPINFSRHYRRSATADGYPARWRPALVLPPSQRHEGLCFGRALGSPSSPIACRQHQRLQRPGCRARLPLRSSAGSSHTLLEHTWTPKEVPRVTRTVDDVLTVESLEEPARCSPRSRPLAVTMPIIEIAGILDGLGMDAHHAPHLHTATSSTAIVDVISPQAGQRTPGRQRPSARRFATAGPSRLMAGALDAEHQKYPETHRRKCPSAERAPAHAATRSSVPSACHPRSLLCSIFRPPGAVPLPRMEGPGLSPSDTGLGANTVSSARGAHTRRAVGLSFCENVRRAPPAHLPIKHTVAFSRLPAAAPPDPPPEASPPLAKSGQKRPKWKIRKDQIRKGKKRDEKTDDDPRPLRRRENGSGFHSEKPLGRSPSPSSSRRAVLSAQRLENRLPRARTPRDLPTRTNSRWATAEPDSAFLLPIFCLSFFVPPPTLRPRFCFSRRRRGSARRLAASRCNQRNNGTLDAKTCEDAQKKRDPSGILVVVARPPAGPLDFQIRLGPRGPTATVIVVP